MLHRHNFPRVFSCLLVFLGTTLVTSAEARQVKVFVLAGQSNMEGKVQNPLLEHQAGDPKTREYFAHLREDNEWIVRDDVFIRFLGRHGGLTVGYGSPGRTGVELQLGTVLGDHYREPVLLIKAAWGGHSLFKPFRPPSAGLPGEAFLKDELEKARERVRKENEKHGREEPLPTMEQVKEGYGASYRNMLELVRETMEDAGDLFPALRGKRLELAGFVWFQGWNDQYNGAEKEYEANLRHLIEDVRKDLKAPGLPFVIGVMGQNGSKPAQGAMAVIQEAQLAVPRRAEFLGNVAAVRTDLLVDKAAEELYPRWREENEAWQKTGSDHPYHYLGSAIWHVRMGDAFAQALLELAE